MGRHELLVLAQQKLLGNNMKNTTNISGVCAPSFSKLKDVFEKNFAAQDEVGASIALVKDGELIVNLWGGLRDPDSASEWQRDTLVNVWSTTKGITALCFAMLVDRGQISYASPIAEYWPEFRVGNRQNMTVSMMLSHQGGLCGFRDPVDIEFLYNIERAADTLARMEPFWEPGTRFGYHAITIGFLASELFRRVEGRSIKQFVEDELHQAFDLDFFIGLPASRNFQAATIVAPKAMGSSADLATNLSKAQLAALANPVLSPTLPNTSAWREAEIPSANGFSSAEALATLYGALASDGCIKGKRLLGLEAINAARAPQTKGVDEVLGLEIEWSNGFLCNAMNVYGPNSSAFGHSGWGGSFAFADPKRGIGFAYTMNRMGTELVGDPRNTALIEALYHPDTFT